MPCFDPPNQTLGTSRYWARLKPAELAVSLPLSSPAKFQLTAVPSWIAPRTSRAHHGSIVLRTSHQWIGSPGNYHVRVVKADNSPYPCWIANWIPIEGFKPTSRKPSIILLRLDQFYHPTVAGDWGWHADQRVHSTGWQNCWAIDQ